MKKTILAIVMAVMIATPCFAQDVEPDGIFSVDGTLWTLCSVVFSYILPPYADRFCLDYGFYQGKVYACRNAGLGYNCIQTNEIYFNTPVISILYGVHLMPPMISLGIMQVNSFGVYTALSPIAFAFGILSKTDDNWTPPEIK